jgi:hypothetical protein
MEKTNTMTTIYERLKALQINLPELPPPLVDAYVPSFVPFVRAGNRAVAGKRANSTSSQL